MSKISNGIRKFFTIIKLGLKGIWTHRSMGFASIFSIFASLFVLGVVLIIAVTANSVVIDIHSKVDEVELFVKDDLSDQDIDDLGKELNNDDRVKEVKYRTSEEALEIMKKSWGKEASILEGVDVLPSSYIVKLKDIRKVQEFVNDYNTKKNVDDVKYYQDIVGKVSLITKFVQTGGLILTILLVLVSMFIISNTIKLTIYARNKEILVMKNVGATNHMVRGPFIVEGIIFGLIASLIAYFILLKLYEYVYINYSRRLYNIISSYMVNPSLISMDLLKIFLSLGIGIGAVGSTFSMRKHLKV